MRARRLGAEGPVVSVVGLGCNNLDRDVDRDGTRAIVNAALDVGVTLFDTADVYGTTRGGSETLLGEALVGRRNRVLLATKFGGRMSEEEEGAARGSRTYIRRAVEGSLRRLQTDWIDLYQYHHPDAVTPIEETLAALDELVQEGKVRHVGSSNFSTEQLRDADRLAREHGWTRFVSAQNHYSLLRREAEAELLPACESLGVGVLPYFPLANGLLTGKYRRGEPPPEGTRLARRRDWLTEEAFDRVEALERFADERGRTLLEVAIGGLAAQPAIGSVIAGARGPEQVRENALAGDWAPTGDDLAELSQALEP